MRPGVRAEDARGGPSNTGGDVSTRFLFAMSLVQAGRGVALVGLLLGAGSFLTTGRRGRPASGPYGRGQDRAAKAMAVPLLVVGVIGVVLWVVGSLRS